MMFTHEVNAPRSMAAGTGTGDRGGFSIIEIMVVLALIALLAGLATPMVTSAIQRAKEATLKENLFITRKAIDDYFADNGGYPRDLNQLVEKRYIRTKPMDPITKSRNTWILVRDDNLERENDSGIVDLRSGAPGTSGSGSRYSSW